ncbi:MAG: helix-turn-helix transcriptional regulator [Candidatus Accumulibacter sp.]|jgi:transcriptional regulator with XRE-family HTH domain|nr:helix-turn-helix transcriptional regulator [Accumulibacter sp.]
METVKTLLDRVKTLTGAQTDYALAKALNLHRGLISDYYAGKRTPNEFACLQIAEALGKSYEEIQTIVRIEAERDEGRKRAWQNYYARISHYAASIFIALAVTLIMTSVEKAFANQRVTASEVPEYKLCVFQTPRNPSRTHVRRSR